MYAHASRLADADMHCMQAQQCASNHAWFSFAGLATNLLKKLQLDSRTVHVHNRTPDKANPLLEQGATWAPSPARIGELCSIVFSCVFSDTALKAVFADYLSGQSKQGSLYVDCSTVSPDTIRQLDAEAKPAGDPRQCCLS